MTACMRFVRSLKQISLLAGLLLWGCAVDPAVKPWWTLHESNLKQLQAGKSTKTDVRALLGKPVSEMSFPHQGEDVWDIRFVDGTIVMLA